jgi:hypothetical protein
MDQNVLLFQMSSCLASDGDLVAIVLTANLSLRTSGSPANKKGHSVGGPLTSYTQRFTLTKIVCPQAEGAAPCVVGGATSRREERRGRHARMALLLTSDVELINPCLPILLQIHQAEAVVGSLQMRSPTTWPPT